MDPGAADYPFFGRTATSRDAPNPLRPYYIPPSIGLPPDAAGANTSTSSTYPPKGFTSSSSTSPKHDFRELFPDLDYGDYIGDKSEGLGDLAKRILDQAIWNYASVFLAQPFEVAKVILQCHEAGVHTLGSAPSTPLNSQKRWQNSYEDVRYSDVRETISLRLRQLYTDAI